MTKRKSALAAAAVFALISVAAITTCRSGQKSAGDTAKACAHCHGENLEGVKFVKNRCGECHDQLKLAPAEVSSEEIKKAVNEPPHPHRAGNLFSQTPSCFLCHRKSDF